MCSAKTAILVFYIRVFGTVTWLRRTAYVGIVIMALFYSMSVVVSGVYCFPRRGETWEGLTSARFLRHTTNLWPYVTVGAFSCLADILIFILPFPIVAKLHVDLRKKLALTVVFGTGLV